MNKFSNTTKPTSPYRNVKPNTSASHSVGVKVIKNGTSVPGIRPINARPKPPVLPNSPAAKEAARLKRIQQAARRRRRVMFFGVSAFASVLLIGTAVAVPLTLEYMSSTNTGENNAGNNTGGNNTNNPQVPPDVAREKLNKASLLISNNIEIDKTNVDSQGDVYPAGKVTPSTFGDYVTGFGVENGVHVATGVKVEVTTVEPSADNTRLTATLVMSYGTETMTKQITVAGFLNSEKAFEKTWNDVLYKVAFSDEARNRLSLTADAKEFSLDSVGKWLVNWKDVNEWGVRLTRIKTEISISDQSHLNGVKITFQATIGTSSATKWFFYGGFKNK